MSQALKGLVKYGVRPPEENSDVWSVLLQHAPAQPIRAYAIAASYGIESICVQASRHTLSTSLDMISEADALEMGAIYLRRLFFLHVGRRDALQRVISPPPKHHRATSTCTAAAQASRSQVWTVTASDIVTRRQAHGMSPEELVQAYTPLFRETACQLCIDALRVRMADIIPAWLAIKNYI